MFSCTRQGTSLLPALSMPATCQGPQVWARAVNYTWLPVTDRGLSLCSHLGGTQFQSQSSGKEQVDVLKECCNGGETGHGQSTLNNTQVKKNDQASVKTSLYH